MNGFSIGTPADRWGEPEDLAGLDNLSSHLMPLTLSQGQMGLC